MTSASRSVGKQIDTVTSVGVAIGQTESIETPINDRATLIGGAYDI